MKRLWNALLYSLSGLWLAYRDEAAFRQEVWLSLLLLPLSFVIAPDAISWAMMVFSLLMVWVAELANTAVEALADRISEEHHPLLKKAKDTASAAVLIALIAMACVWGAVLWPQ